MVIGWQSSLDLVPETLEAPVFRVLSFQQF